MEIGWNDSNSLRRRHRNLQNTQSRVQRQREYYWTGKADSNTTRYRINSICSRMRDIFTSMCTPFAKCCLVWAPFGTIISSFLGLLFRYSPEYASVGVSTPALRVSNHLFGAAAIYAIIFGTSFYFICGSRFVRYFCPKLSDTNRRKGKDEEYAPLIRLREHMSGYGSTDE